MGFGWSSIAEVSHLAPAPPWSNRSTAVQESNLVQGQTQKALQDKLVRPESNRLSLFEPPPQSLVIRLVVKQLKCLSKPKGALIHDECAPARVNNRRGAPFPLSCSALCPAATRAADLGRCPRVDTGGWGWAEEDWPGRSHWPWPFCWGCCSTYMLGYQRRDNTGSRAEIH